MKKSKYLLSAAFVTAMFSCSNVCATTKPPSEIDQQEVSNTIIKFEDPTLKGGGPSVLTQKKVSVTSEIDEYTISHDDVTETNQETLKKRVLEKTGEVTINFLNGYSETAADF